MTTPPGEPDTAEPTAIPVLFCTEGLFPYEVGGIQRHSRLLAESLDDLGGVRLHVVHPECGEDPFAGRPNVVSIPLPPRPRKRAYLREVHAWSKGVLEVAEAHPGHVIYSQGLAVWSGVEAIADRLIVNPHGLEAYQAIGLRNRARCAPFRWIFDRIFRKAARIVSLGGKLTPILASRSGNAGKVVTIPNAVVVPGEIEKSFEPPTRFLFVGRFARNKGIDVLLRSVAQLNEAGLGNAFQVDLVGDGPLRKTLEQTFASPNVTYHGKVSDAALWTLYENTHALVLPTMFEGMPTVILEAMARGAPAITTDVGATSELVNAQTGVLIPIRDARALAMAMRRFVEMPRQEKSRMSVAAYAHVAERFSWEHVAREHLALFRDVAR